MLSDQALVFDTAALEEMPYLVQDIPGSRPSFGLFVHNVDDSIMVDVMYQQYAITLWRANFSVMTSTYIGGASTFLYHSQIDNRPQSRHVMACNMGSKELLIMDIESNSQNPVYPKPPLKDLSKYPDCNSM